MPKRGAGEGSIFKKQVRRASGKVDTYWVGELLTGRDAAGRRKVFRVYGKSRREVAEKLAKAQLDKGAGVLAEPSRETVGEFLSRWLQDSVKHSVRPRTFESYSLNVRRHLAPEIGHLALRKLTPGHVQRFYRKKLEEGLSPRTVQYLHAILHRALEQALRWGLAPRNVADAVDAPKPARREMQALTPEQADRFLEATRTDRLHALFALAVGCGLRQSELLGLAWSDVDLEAGRIQVQRQLQYLRRVGPVLSEPKSARGRRSIALPAFVVEALRQHRKQQLGERLALGPAWQNEWNLVFVTQVGTPIEATNLVRHFKGLLRRAGLPEIRFHDLRHSCASLLLAAGEHPKVVQELLGHSNISLTLDSYSHVLPTLQKQAAAKMDALLKNARR